MAYNRRMSSMEQALRIRTRNADTRLMYATRRRAETYSWLVVNGIRQTLFCVRVHVELLNVLPKNAHKRLSRQHVFKFKRHKNSRNILLLTISINYYCYLQIIQVCVFHFFTTDGWCKMGSGSICTPLYSWINIINAFDPK